MSRLEEMLVLTRFLLMRKLLSSTIIGKKLTFLLIRQEKLIIRFSKARNLASIIIRTSNQIAHSSVFAGGGDDSISIKYLNGWGMAKLKILFLMVAWR